MATVYIAFYSRTGELEQMAQGLAEGVTWQGGHPVIAYIPPDPDDDETMAADPEWSDNDRYCREKYPIAEPEQLLAADGAAFGTPAVLGTVATEMIGFLSSVFVTQKIGTLFNKPAGTFMAARKGDPGHELANYAMWLPLSLLGYTLVGVTANVPALRQTYDDAQALGAFHGVLQSTPVGLNRKEWTTAHILGGRLAMLAEACKAVAGLEAFQEAGTREAAKQALGSK